MIYFVKQKVIIKLILPTTKKCNGEIMKNMYHDFKRYYSIIQMDNKLTVLFVKEVTNCF